MLNQSKQFNIFALCVLLLNLMLSSTNLPAKFYKGSLHYNMQQKQFCTYIKKALSKDAQQKIRQAKIHHAIFFLGSQPITLAGHVGMAEPVVINGNKVITGSHDGTVRIWDKDNGQLLQTLIGHSEIILSMAVSDNNNILVTGSSDRTVKIWDIKTGTLLHTLPECGFPVAISGNKVVAGNGQIAKIWDINTGKLLHTLEGHTDIIASLVTYGNKVATGSWDETTKIWDINTGKLLHTLTGHARIFSAVAMNADKVVTIPEDGTAKIWDLKTGRLLYTLAEDTGAILSVAISGNKLITGVGSDRATIKVWDIRNGKLLRSFKSPNKDNKAATYVAANGEKVVTAFHADETAKVWNIKTGEVINLVGPHGHTGWVRPVAICGDVAVTGSIDGTAKIWPLSINLHGTPENNPLVWIIQNASHSMFDFIKRAYHATLSKNEFVLISLSEDEKIFSSFPQHVQQYLLERLNIRKIK